MIALQWVQQTGFLFVICSRALTIEEVYAGDDEFSKNFILTVNEYRRLKKMTEIIIQKMRTYRA